MRRELLLGFVISYHILRVGTQFETRTDTCSTYHKIVLLSLPYLSGYHPSFSVFDLQALAPNT